MSGNALLRRIAEAEREVASRTPPRFEYEPWRHGGWYVHGVRYPDGGCGCVSRSLVNPATGKADRRWRIVCDQRAGDHVYPNRDHAALAEWHLAQARALESNR